MSNRLKRVDPEDGFKLSFRPTTILLLHSVNHNLFGHRDPVQWVVSGRGNCS